MSELKRVCRLSHPGFYLLPACFIVHAADHWPRLPPPTLRKWDILLAGSKHRGNGTKYLSNNKRKVITEASYIIPSIVDIMRTDVSDSFVSLRRNKPLLDSAFVSFNLKNVHILMHTGRFNGRDASENNICLKGKLNLFSFKNAFLKKRIISSLVLLKVTLNPFIITTLHRNKDFLCWSHFNMIIDANWGDLWYASRNYYHII